MNGSSIATVAALVGALALVLAAVAVAARRGNWPAELTRKSLHVALGFACLGFPWLFRESWPVWLFAAVATAVLVALRLPPLDALVGRVLHTVPRRSVGELLYMPAVALVFQLADGRHGFFLVPVLILALADTAGALAGTRWGKSRYASGHGRKSVEGSTAFLLCAIACTAGPLLATCSMPADKILWIALTLGMLATMLEGLADHGFDNLLLPLGGFFMLDRLAALDASTLAVHCAITLALVTLLTVCGRVSTLDGGALLAAGLLGYGLAVLGGGWFVVPVLGLFAVHLATAWRHRLGGRLRHGVESVAGVALATLPWAAARPMLGETCALSGCALAAAAMLALMHAGTRRFFRHPKITPMAGLAKGVGAAVVPAVLVTRERATLAPLAAGLVLAFGGMFLLAWLHDRWPRSERGLWLTMGGLALACSAPCLWLAGLT